MEKKFKVIIIDRDETTRNIVKDYLTNISDVETTAEFVDYNMGYDFAVKQNECIVLFDISDNPSTAEQTIKKLYDNNKNAYIIALSNKTSTDTIIKIMRAGAKEFINKPVIKSEFINTINEITDSKKTTANNNSCKIISTFSNKGGIGKTSIAVNLAVELAETTKEKVALIDLNLQLGDVSTFLDLNPSFDMSYVVSNIQNLDETNILNTLTRYKNTSLYVVADPVNIEKSKEITTEQIKMLIETLKKTFSYVIIDIGTNIDGKTIAALDASDLILLIAIVNLPAIRNIQRCMNLFKKLQYPNDKIKLVLNRYMENEEIKTSDIEDVVNQKVYWKIPNNYLTMMSAINKGAPVSTVNQESNIAINYKDFAAKLTDYLITQKINKNYNERVIL